MSAEPPERPPHRWRPIEDLPVDRSALEAAAVEVSGLRRAWLTKKQELETSGGLSEFNRRLIRLWCVETGVIEGLYSVSEGVTRTLVEKGFDAAYISHGETDVPAPHLIAVLKDHERAVEGLFSFVKQDRKLTTSYVKGLHAVLTAHQETCDGIDQVGNPVKVSLIRGDWKKLPNNPSAGEPLRVIHEYCPPEHVASEMDHLIEMHAGHVDLEPEVAAAWLHHRITQIHPFQDGNGRVARALATLVLLQRNGFPLVVKRTDKPDYIDALRTADDGDLLPLTRQFCRLQKDAFLQAIEQGTVGAESVLDVPMILEDVRKKLWEDVSRRPETVLRLAHTLQEHADRKLNELAAQVRRTLKDIAHVVVSVHQGLMGKGASPAAAVTATAELLGYRVDLDRPATVSVLGIAHGRMTSIVVAFHFVEKAGALVMAANVSVVQSGISAVGGERSEPACTEPFTFTADHKFAEILTAFTPWLDRSLKLGLAIWRRSL